MLSLKGFEFSRRIPSGSVLFVCIGSTIGKVGIAATELTTNQQINAVTPGPDVDPEYLYYALGAVAESVKFKAGEQAVPLVNKSDFSDVRIQVPKLSEQRLIAGVLQDADATISSLESLIVKKQAIKQGMMQQLLTGKTRLPGFTDDWHELGFDESVETVNTRASRVDAHEYKVSGILPVVDQSKHSIAGYTDLPISPVQPGSEGLLVFGDHTCVTKLVDFQFLVGADGTKVLRSRHPSEIQIHFVAYLLELKPVEPTGYNRHFSMLRERAFQFPTYEEQEAIVEVLANVDAEIDALERRLCAIRAIKQGMMQELLTGRTRLMPAGESA
tara:strand:- start:4852 stop:5838 length:987 start_codon:yes stop_codon:yes gene_type:complete